MKNLLYIFLTLFLLSCTQEAPTENEIAVSESYLPLQVGNEWHLFGLNPMKDSIIIKYKITKEITHSNGINYFVLEKYQGEIENNKKIFEEESYNQLLRSNNKSEYYFINNNTSKDELYMIFKDTIVNSQQSDIYRFESEVVIDKSELEFSLDDVSDYFIIRRFTETPSISNYEVFAKGYGLISAHYGKMYPKLNLIYAKIGNKVVYQND